MPMRFDRIGPFNFLSITGVDMLDSLPALFYHSGTFSDGACSGTAGLKMGV